MFNLIIFILKFVFLAILYLFLLLVIRAIYKDDFKMRKIEDSVEPRVHTKRKTAPSRLVIIESPSGQSGMSFDLDDSLTIGRNQESDIVLNDTFASDFHACIRRKEGDYFVEDMGSTNGTLVKDEAINRPVLLNLGDRIRVGKTVLEYVE